MGTGWGLLRTVVKCTVSRRGNARAVAVTVRLAVVASGWRHTGVLGQARSSPR